LSIVSAHRAYTSEQVNNFIKGFVADVLKQHLTNYTVLDGQISREREEFVRAVRAKCQELFTRWGLELVNMEVEIHIPDELIGVIKEKQKIPQMQIMNDVEEQRLKAGLDLSLLKLETEKILSKKYYDKEIETERSKGQLSLVIRENNQKLRAIDIELTKLGNEISKLDTESTAFNTERIAQAQAIQTELLGKAHIAAELLKNTTESEIKIKVMDAESKGKTDLAQIDAWKEVEKAKAEAQRKIAEEENKLKTIKEIGVVLSEMAQSVAVGGIEGQAARMGLEQKFVELLHQIGVDVPDYERSIRSGKSPSSEIKIEKKIIHETNVKKCAKCSRELRGDAKFCDSCGEKQ
jgi:hypothetical protein